MIPFICIVILYIISHVKHDQSAKWNLIYSYYWIQKFFISKIHPNPNVSWFKNLHLLLGKQFPNSSLNNSLPNPTIQYPLKDKSSTALKHSSQSNEEKIISFMDLVQSFHLEFQSIFTIPNLDFVNWWSKDHSLRNLNQPTIKRQFYNSLLQRTSSFVES